VPSEPNQNNPHETVSLIYDDRRPVGDAGAGRLASPRMYSQSRARGPSRIVANATIEDAEGRAATVRSKFLMVEYRGTARLFTGTAWHAWCCSTRHPASPGTRRSGQLRRAAGWNYPAVWTRAWTHEAQPNASNIRTLNRDT